MAASLPHSFVLADLFDVSSMSLDVPDHVLESAPGLALVPCAACEGKGWLECYGSAWGASCAAWDRPDLNFTLKPCTRCHTEGEVLAVTEPAPISLSEPLCERCRVREVSVAHNGTMKPGRGPFFSFWHRHIAILWG